MFERNTATLPEKIQPTMDILDMLYRRSDVMNISVVEQDHASALASEAFAMYMDSVDGGMSASPAEFADVPCTTFELQVAQMAGECAQTRLKLIDKAMKGGIFSRLLGSRPARIDRIIANHYGDFTTVTALIRMRSYDEVFESRRFSDIPPGRAVAEVTGELMLNERVYYL